MEYIIKIAKFLEESGLLMKGVSETTENKAKEQESGILSMLSGILGGSLSRNLLSGKCEREENME